eukprot:6151710-Amphidinium_carterae.1
MVLSHQDTALDSLSTSAPPAASSQRQLEQAVVYSLVTATCGRTLIALVCVCVCPSGMFVRRSAQRY